MNTRQWFFSALAVCLIIPMITFAQGSTGSGLVPCGNPGQPPCQTCHLVDLVQGVAGWLVGILSLVAAIMFVIAGYRILTAGGNPSAMTAAKNMITNVIIGFVIVLSAWLIIDTVMKSLLTDGSVSFGPWNGIPCVEQPGYASIPPFIGFPVTDGSRGTAFNPGGGDPISDVALARIAELSAGDADILIAETASTLGMTQEQVRNMQALLRVESNGCRNVVSNVGALGCMQIMPDTARGYDDSLNGLSDAQVRERLLDPAYNVPLGVRIYNDLSQRFTEPELVHAAYNGGPGALGESRDCPGLRRYECVWDSPGCYVNGQTVSNDCTPNTGYIETRNYVEKVEGVANNL